MDDLGLGSALKVAFRVFEISSRRTGRTERLLASARPGDRIVVATGQEKRRLERRLRELDKSQVEVRVAQDRRGLDRLGVNRGGATLFDHTWVERYFEQSIDRLRSELDVLQRELSSAPEPKPEPYLVFGPVQGYGRWLDAEYRG